MKPFRSVCTAYRGDDFWINVIGYRQLFRQEVHSVSGVEDFFLFILPRGSWCYTFGEKKLITQDSLIIQSPYTMIRHGKEGGLVRSWVRFNGRGIESLCLQNSIEPGRLYETGNLSEHEEYLLSLYRELHHPKGFISQNSVNIFTNWLRAVRRDSSRSYQVPDRRLLRAREYMEQNFIHSPVIQDICTYCGLSKNSLHRLFVTHYRISPKQYMISLKLSHAKELLATSNLSLECIAEESGFSDRYYFSRCFKSQTGITPGRYRKQSEGPL